MHAVNVAFLLRQYPLVRYYPLLTYPLPLIFVRSRTITLPSSQLQSSQTQDRLGSQGLRGALAQELG